jgi:exopolysaccharide biosynthesis polyprenyl glycosylphosphotransferase
MTNDRSSDPSHERPSDAPERLSDAPERPTPDRQSDRPPAFYKRRKKRGNELGQILLRRGVVTPEQLREALRVQEEQGGHVGAILTRMGACDARAIAEALIDQVHLAREAGKKRNLALDARANPSIVGLQVKSRPGLTRALLFSVDILLLTGCLLAAWAVTGERGFAPLNLYGIAVVVTVTIADFAAAHLYAPTPPSPPEELRLTTFGVSLVFGAFGLATALGHRAFFEDAGLGAMFEDVGLWSWLIGWALAVWLVPSGRAILRWRCARRLWWGHAVVVLGADKLGRAVVRTLLTNPRLGLKPVAILDDDPSRHGTLRATFGERDLDIESVRSDEARVARQTYKRTDPDADSSRVRAVWGQFSEVEGVPVIGGLSLAPLISQRLGIKTAVVAMPSEDSGGLFTAVERFSDSFTRVLLVPDLLNLAYFGAVTQDLGGVLGIEVRRQLLLRGPRLVKRIMDVILTGMGVVLLSPVLLLLTLLVRFDSPGPVFYRQKRLGQDGVRFNALKFRTMYGDGEQRLKELLERDLKLRAEYDEFHKLSDDPRITRVGKVLRRYSLDELPQLWNVFVGDMSLVGPRPYLEREIPDMGQQEAVILRVKPGITGIWQVTDRNATGFDQRVKLDVEYVRNWSPWLDIFILAKTVPVVLIGTGS